MTGPQDGLHRTELAAPGGRRLEATGVFHLHGALYTVTFDTPEALDTFLDLYLTRADDTRVARLHLTPQGTGLPAANLRFQLNVAHQVAAAVLIAMDAEGRSHSWMTRGDGARDRAALGVVLAHDTWHREETAMPPEAYITVAQLRAVLREWAFGDTLPPPAVGWAPVRDVGWF